MAAGQRNGKKEAFWWWIVPLVRFIENLLALPGRRDSCNTWIRLGGPGQHPQPDQPGPAKAGSVSASPGGVGKLIPAPLDKI